MIPAAPPEDTHFPPAKLRPSPDWVVEAAVHLVPGTSTLGVPPPSPCVPRLRCRWVSCTQGSPPMPLHAGLLTQAPLHVVPMFSPWSTGQIRPPASQARTKLNVPPRTHPFPWPESRQTPPRFLPRPPYSTDLLQPGLVFMHHTRQTDSWTEAACFPFLSRVIPCLPPSHDQTLSQRPSLHRHIPHPPRTHPPVLSLAHPVFLKFRTSSDSRRSYTNMKGNYFFAELYW